MADLDSSLPPSSSALERRFIKHYGSTLLGQALLLGLGALSGILVARMLGPSGRGEYAAIFTWALAIANQITFGINQAVVYHLGKRPFSFSEIATAVTVIATIQSVLSVAVCLFAFHFALVRYNESVQHMGRVLVLSTPAIIFGLYSANLFQGMQDLRRFNFLRAVAPATYCAGLIAIYFLHLGTLRLVIYSLATSYVLAMIVGLAMVLRLMKPRWRWNAHAFPRLFSFGFRMQATSITFFINQRIDQLVLSVMVPAKELGLYAVAVTLTSLVGVLPQATGIVAFSKGASQHGRDAKETIGHAFRVSLIWLLASCALLYVLCPLIIHFVLGSSFDGSAEACRILIPGVLMSGLSQVLYNGAGALGRPGLSSIAEGASVAVTLVGLYVLTPRYGYIGAAAVSSSAYTLSFVTMLLLTRGYLKVGFRDLLGVYGRHAVAPAGQT